MTFEPTTSADQEDNQENGAAQAEQQQQPAEHHPQKVYRNFHNQNSKIEKMYSEIKNNMGND